MHAPDTLAPRAPKLPRLGEHARYRLGVASRAVAAIVLGYGLTAVVTALLALALPMARADAVITATLLSFAIYTCAVLWVFAARSATRAWLGLALPTIVLGAVVFVLYRFAGSAA